MSVLADEHFAVKYCPRVVVEHTAVSLVRGAVRHQMIYYRMRVCVLGAVDHIQPVHKCLCSLSGEFYIHVMPRQGGSEIYVRRIVPAARPESYLGRANVKR